MSPALAGRWPPRRVSACVSRVRLGRLPLPMVRHHALPALPERSAPRRAVRCVWPVRLGSSPRETARPLVLLVQLAHSPRQRGRQRAWRAPVVTQQPFKRPPRVPHVCRGPTQRCQDFHSARPVPLVHMPRRPAAQPASTAPRAVTWAGRARRSAWRVPPARWPPRRGQARAPPVLWVRMPSRPVLRHAPCVPLAPSRPCPDRCRVHPVHRAASRNPRAHPSASCVAPARLLPPRAATNRFPCVSQRPRVSSRPRAGAWTPPCAWTTHTTLGGARPPA